MIPILIQTDYTLKPFGSLFFLHKHQITCH